MNGKRAKQIRRAKGETIAMRRDRRAFERQVTDAVLRRTEVRYRDRQRRRVAVAWLGIGLILLCIAAALAR